MSNTKDTIKTGFLTKSPPENKGPFFGWRRRFFMFIDSSRVYPFAPRHIRMEYYTSLEESKNGNPLNSINLNDCSGVLKREPLKGHKYVFDVVTPTRVFHLSADSNEEREDWVSLLNTNIFAYNNMRPMNQASAIADASMKQSKRSSEFQPEFDFNQRMTAKQESKSVNRSQSLRDKKTIEPLSPTPKPDVFFPLLPNVDNPNAYSSNLTILPQPTSPEPVPDASSLRASLRDNEIISAPSFTAVPQSYGLFNPHSSLPVTNESQYMNIERHTPQGAAPQVSLSVDSSPTHPMPMVPAPYKKFPEAQSPPSEPIESEYSCIDSSTISDSILLQYAKVQRKK